MKTQLLLLTLVSITIASHGQDSIPNGSFEKWNSTTYENPLNYPFTSNETALYDASSSFNVIKTTDAFHGQSAVQVSTLTASFGTYMGYFLNTPAKNGNISLWTGGMPYSEKPTGIRGYYKYNVATADSAMIILVFRKGTNTIGTYQYRIGGIKNTYTLFNMALIPALTETPDSVVFGIVSSDYMKNENGVPGSILKIDSVSFTGVTNQPLAMNGDFEFWQQNQSPYELDGWNESNNNSKGLNRTTDAKTGQYALELTTYLGEENGTPRAQPGNATTGYYDNTCSCTKGGKPYSQQIDTLAFWYKYSPTSNDNAQISLDFRKNGLHIWWEQKALTAATNYQYVEIPFNVWQVPDTMIVQIQSSLWENKATSFVGSVLKIDNLKFKSQLRNTGIYSPRDDLNISISPNPSNAKFYIHSASLDVFSFDIYNVTGAKVYPTTTISNEINLTNSPNGIYLVRIYTGDKIYTKKILKME
ncbi:MAG TPA: T9SS type A sorting domain-containing protein [Paludibacter sp.]